jgi:hypothetical protein
VTDRLESHGVGHQELIPEAIDDTSQYANNRAALSHQPTRERERERSMLPFQIATAGATVSRCICGCIQSLQPRSPSDGRSLLSEIASACLCILGTGGSRMRPRSGQDSLASKS